MKSLLILFFSTKNLTVKNSIKLHVFYIHLITNMKIRLAIKKLIFKTQEVLTLQLSKTTKLSRENNSQKEL